MRTDFCIPPKIDCSDWRNVEESMHVSPSSGAAMFSACRCVTVPGSVFASRESGTERHMLVSHRKLTMSISLIKFIHIFGAVLFVGNIIAVHCGKCWRTAPASCW
jgi:hypothetical protein